MKNDFSPPGLSYLQLKAVTSDGCLHEADNMKNMLWKFSSTPPRGNFKNERKAKFFSGTCPSWDNKRVWNYPRLPFDVCTGSERMCKMKASIRKSDDGRDLVVAGRKNKSEKRKNRKKVNNKILKRTIKWKKVLLNFSVYFELAFSSCRKGKWVCSKCRATEALKEETVDDENLI